MRDHFYLPQCVAQSAIFVQISDEMVNRVRVLMDEVFGEDNFCSLIFFSKTTGTSNGILPTVGDLIVWYSKSRPNVKFRQALRQLPIEEELNKEFKDLLLPDLRRRKTTDEERENSALLPNDARVYRTNTAVSPEASPTLTKEVTFLCGGKKHCGEQRHWKTGDVGLLRLEKADRLDFSQGPTRMFRRFFTDSEYASITNIWTDIGDGNVGGFPTPSRPDANKLFWVNCRLARVSCESLYGK